MKLWTQPLFGQCECGGSLTIHHLQYHCPLRPRGASREDLEKLRYTIEQIFRGQGFAAWCWIRYRSPTFVLRKHGPMTEWQETWRKWREGDR